MIEGVLSVNPLFYLLVPAAFIIGSIPFGLLFTRSTGIDIRQHGSRNIGATNVLRTAGKKPAILTLLGDILKGTSAVVLCKIVLVKTGHDDVAASDFWLGLISLTAVLGHMFSIFLSFKGGKGVATGFGVLAIYSPAIAGIMLGIWLLTASIIRYSSLAALIAFGAMPLMFYFSGYSDMKISFGLLIALFILYKHKTNIKKLIDGTESRIGGKKSS